MTEEQRIYPRWSVSVPVSFTGEQLRGEGTVTNLSLGGCAIQAHDRARKGSTLSLRIQLPDQDDPVTIATAEVRWTAPGGFGVQFLSVQHGELERLQRFLQSRGDHT